tara:strand:- start:713 stop:1153 length:441 start_codon:yes stop_codon:yes gene_type:complete
MQGFAISNLSNKNLKQKADGIIIDLFKNGIKVKYQIFGKCIYLESKDKITQKHLNEKIHYAKLSTDKKKEIYNTIRGLLKGIKEPKNFAVKVDRKGEHKYKSTELAKEMASAAFDEWPNVKVNLDRPSLEIIIQIINNRSIIYLRN